MARLPDYSELELTHLISRGRGDISDPIGGPLEQYRRCAEQMDNYLQTWADELPLDGA